MDTSQIAALIGAAVLAFVVRVFNIVTVWLARVLDVEAPDPIRQPGKPPTTDAT